MVRRKSGPAFKTTAAATGEVRDGCGSGLSSLATAQATRAGSDLLALIDKPAEALARPAGSPTKVTPHYHGHRERLRERFHDAGAAALSDY